MTYEQLIQRISHIVDLPPREVERVMYLFGESLYQIPIGEKLETPFGEYSPKLLKPEVVKIINKIPIYGPVQYTISYVPAPDLVLDVPDPDGIAAGTFNPAAMMAQALNRRGLPQKLNPTSLAVLDPESVELFDLEPIPDKLEWAPAVRFDNDEDQ